MANWSRDKVESLNLNGGQEWTTDDQVAVEELNAMVNGGLYAQDFAEALADEPDISEIGNTGTPAVYLIDNVKDGKTYKKFKFVNLKGDQGIQGERGPVGARFEYDATTKTLNIITEE